MEDFASFCANRHKTSDTTTEQQNLSVGTSVVTNEHGAICENPKKSKIGFFQARLNKDNAWNLAFWLFVVGLVGVSEFLAKIFSNTLVLPITIPTFIVAIYLGSKFNPTPLNDKVFLSTDFRIHLFLTALFTMLVTAFIAVPFFLLEGKVVFRLAVTNFVGWTLLTPTIYCILKNSPIALFFHKKLFISNVSQLGLVNNTNFVGYDHRQSNSTSSSPYNNDSLLSTSNLSFHPMNSWYSGNSHHRKH